MDGAIVQHLHRPIPFGDVFNFDHGFAHGVFGLEMIWGARRFQENKGEMVFYSSSSAGFLLGYAQACLTDSDNGIFSVSFGKLTLNNLTLGEVKEVNLEDII